MKFSNSIRTRACAAVMSLLVFSIAWAANIDLATVPGRDAVSLTIYNSEDLTLVRENRVVSFKPGGNVLQFGWANTRIDPTSVRLEFVDRAHELSLLDTRFPHDRPQTLYWNVDSEFAGAARVEISYFTSGITWSADYLLIADRDQRSATLDGYVRVKNASGEDYENAHVRLVVGTINLVQKVAELANVRHDEVLGMAKDRRKKLERRVARQVMSLDQPMPAAAPVLEQAPKQIIKEGLSEYFIFTVAGTETVPSGWSKRMRALHAGQAPLKTVYRLRESEYGAEPVRLYLLRNNTDSGLGQSPLPDGTVRVLQADGRGGLGYQAMQRVRYVPIDGPLEVNLGVDPELVFERVRLATTRDNIWMKLKRANVYRKVGDRELRVDQAGTVAGYDTHDVYAQRVHNTGGRPIKLEVRRVFPGDIEIVTDARARKYDFRTVRFDMEIAAGERLEQLYIVTTRSGRNARQSRVTLRTDRVPVPAYLRRGG